MDASDRGEEDRNRPDISCELRSAQFTKQSTRDSTLSALVRTIESEVIPRLLLALQSTPVLVHGTINNKPSPDDVAEFAGLVTTRDFSVATAYIDALLSKGLSLENIYLELLAPAARLLGEWWKADLRDFTEVTSGLCRMHQLLHEFSPVFLQGAAALDPQKSVLLIPMLGEQHSFGLIMVAEFFRSAGWDVWDLHPASLEDVLGVVRKTWFAIVGVSLACGSKIDEVTPLIAAIRAESRNTAVRVMVGGQPFISHPELVARVGADATSVDGRRAPLEAARLLTQVPPRA